ncbi:unnamed protein product [Lymnaea stagnalis]|uniref:Immunoglobulin subtype domain-containing protein n=1 Tax=Lymnaea stagnalis TaxID=6523 RepID=A0AAV2HGQ8_LYMST
MKFILCFYYLCCCRSVLCVLPITFKTNVSTSEPFTLVCDHLRCDVSSAYGQFFKIELGKSEYEALNNSHKPHLAKIDAKDESRHIEYDTYDTDIPFGRDWRVSFHSDNSTHNRDVLNVTLTVMDTVMEDAGHYFCIIHYYDPSIEECQEEITLTVYRGDWTKPTTSPPTPSTIATTPTTTTEPTTTTTVTTTKKPPPTDHGNCIVARGVQDVLGRLFIALTVWLLVTIF